MSKRQFKNALVSVSDKTGLKEFLQPLVVDGLRVVSTGGTAQYLRENKIPVIEVSEQTGFPEVMDGRVRTLHPKIHMALLARLENPQDMELMREYEIEPFDLVIGNLYPFEKFKEQNLSDRELSEYIDIGGPALLRAAAKNFEQTTVLCDPQDYLEILNNGMPGLEKRKILAAKLFQHISSYDSMIAHHLNDKIFEKDQITFAGEIVQRLRYGENPQQEAIWLKEKGVSGGLHSSQTLQGKALSFNNILDLDSAVDVLLLFKEPCCVAVKHNNPCGVAIGRNIEEATGKALKADPISVFGGVIALNRTVTAVVARELSNLFLECIIAPQFDEEARGILAAKKNLRLLEYDFKKHQKKYQLRSIAGGFLLQSMDSVCEVPDPNWKIYGKEPSQEILNDLLFSWRVCASLKSNAIAIAAGGTTLGLGMGQVSRIDSVEQAISRMKKYFQQPENPVMASDAFFPFADSIELAAQNGIRWIIQPGGSMKDEDVIAMAKKQDVTMVITGARHFRH